ncbi:hypothetical protein pipiens_019672 [Culex pipiens pipiens]|uniref:Gustatory receptor n=1 Tax=Culex pipiens pipiens TaxID=38569 RepID=A0ABD1DTA0_CULPP
MPKLFRIRTQPSSSGKNHLQSYPQKPDEFSELFLMMIKCFRQFGLYTVRIRYVKGHPRFEASRVLVVIAVLILLSSWVVLVVSFFLQYRTPVVTGVANHIQFITNVLALTASLGIAIFKGNELNGILQDFCVIDDELSYFSVRLPHKQLKKGFLRFYVIHVVFLIVSILFDGYVMLIMSTETPIWLWFFHLLPFTLYSLAFMNAFMMIRWVKLRINLLNTLIDQYHCYPMFNEMGHNNFKLTTIILMNGGEDHLAPKDAVEEPTISTRILTIVSRTIDLATRLESYNGLLFLFGYLALFCVTTIQVYYCYLHVAIGSTSKGFSGVSLALSVLIIVGNMIATLAIPYICEQVGDEFKTLMSYLSKLSMRYGQNMQSSIWFPNLISSIKFSAMGFFNMNYSMLSGFIAGLITYLIIFIQFNAIVPADDSTQQLVRAMKEQKQ